jgi:hypothetical protein
MTTVVPRLKLAVRIVPLVAFNQAAHAHAIAGAKLFPVTLTTANVGF